MSRARSALAAFLVLAAAACAAPGGAQAGRIVLVGADLDSHCGDSGAMCRYLARTTAYVRAGAPVPTRPVLVVEHPYGRLLPALGLGPSFGEPEVPVISVDPSSAAFATMPIDTTRYSAILLGSDDHCGTGRGGDCGTLNEDQSTGDSEAVVRRSAAIAAFADAGGGVIALAAGAHGDGLVSGGRDVYYGALPTPPQRQALHGPFTLGPLAAAVGVTDGRVAGTSDEINCTRCSTTHNAFAVTDADPQWGVIVRGTDGLARAVTTIARLRGGVLVATGPEASLFQSVAPVVETPPATTPPAGRRPAAATTVLVSGTDVLIAPARTCVSRRRFVIRVRGLGVGLRSARVVVRGRDVAIVRRAGRLTATVDLRGLRRGRFTVAITARAAEGRTLRGARRYWTCRAPIRGSVPRI